MKHYISIHKNSLSTPQQQFGRSTNACHDNLQIYIHYRVNGLKYEQVKWIILSSIWRRSVN